MHKYAQPLMESDSHEGGGRGHRNLHSASAFVLEGGMRNGPSAACRRAQRQRFFLFRTTSYCFIYWALLSVVLSPFAGAILMALAFRERAVRSFTLNPSDWLVLFFIGLTLQGTTIAPFAFWVTPYAYQEMVEVLEAPGEYYAAFVFPFLCGMHTLMTIFLFIYYRNEYEEDSGAEYGNYSSGGHGVSGGGANNAAIAAQHNNNYDVGSINGSRHGGGGHGNNGGRVTSVDAQKAIDMRNAQIIKKEIELTTRQKTEFVVPVAFAIGVLELVITRVCAFTANSRCNRFISFEIPGYAESTLYTISTIGFMLLFVTFNTSSLFALTLYYQKLLQVREFRYIGSRAAGRGDEANNGSPTNSNSPNGGNGGANKRGAALGGFLSSRGGNNSNTANDFNEREGKRVDNLANPENISTWTITWRQIIVDMKRRPEIRAATNSTFPVMVFVIVFCITYICIYNLFSQAKVAEFTTGFVCLVATCAAIVIGFIHVTVQLADAVDFQTKVIAKLQNDMQVRLDEEGPEMDLFHKQLLTAKVRVLQSLDVYLRHSSSKPKLVGLSMESFRWTIIILGLLMMNVFFFSLYYSHCSSGNGGNGSIF